MFVIILRGNRVRTYHHSLVLELAVLGLWIPPVYYIIKQIVDNPGEAVPASTGACLAMFLLNMYVLS
jgi:hypothetical protein